MTAFIELLATPWTAGLLVAGTILGAAVTLPAMRRIPRLRPAAPGRVGSASVAVVVAARNERATIRPALESLCASLDGETSVVLVDDRSDDGTGEIARALASSSDGLTVVRIDELPRGWLGKNHALHVGARAAKDAEYVLFTDADVVFAPGGVRAAVDRAVDEDLDHLSGAPRVVARSFALAGMVATFGVLFALFTRPWRASDPRSRSYVGIGALNLVRRSAYLAAGGHEPIRMRIDDDLRLARMIKRRGGRSGFVIATRIASVAWYPSLGSLVRGLHKNAFAGIDFRWSVLVLSTAFLTIVFLGPFVLAWHPAATPLASTLFAVAAGLHLLGASESAAAAGLPRVSAAFFPAGIALFLVILWRSALGVLVTRQVTWRGTSYPLSELRARQHPRD